VVAAPAFPLTKPDALGDLDEADLVNQPADVRFVITKLLIRSAATSSALSGMIDPAEIAVAGHSDGGDTAQAVAYGACCLDPRVRAAIVMAGEELFPGGTNSSPGGMPLFVVQGTKDLVNRPYLSQRLYARAGRPKAYLSLIGADHLEPFTGTGPYHRITASLTTDFLDRYLKNLPDASSRLRSDGRSTPSLEKLTLAL
jgi:pimeloyl-ACP methyl ester carboxylesterase